MPVRDNVTLLGVGEVFCLEKLELPILLDESLDPDRVIFNRGAISGGPLCCELYRGYTLQPGMARRMCREERTWMTTFPGPSITSWKSS